MYPLALEKQYEKFLTGAFRKFADRLNRAVLNELKKQTRSDGSLRYDGPDNDILTFLEGLRNSYGDFIDKASLEKEISKNFSMVDAWSRSKTSEALGAISLRLNTPQPPSVTGRPTPAGQSGELWLTTVKAESGMISTLLERANRSNRSMASDLFSQHYDSINKAVSDGIARGDSFNTIAKEIDRVTGVSSGRAKFWARDQVSKYFGEATKVRQTEAGIPGYIWRTMKDARVRDSHTAVNGKFFSWSNPPQAGTKGRRVHPGEDYNCRCFAEPAFGPEYEDKGAQSSGPNAESAASKVSSAKTVREAEGFVRQNNLADNVSFRGVGYKYIDRVNEWNNGIKNVLEDFPALRSRMVFTGTCQEHRAFAIKNNIRLRGINDRVMAASASAKEISGVSINKTFINSPKFLEDLKIQAASGFHPQGCDTIKSLVDHEMGHSLTSLLKLDEDPVINYIWNSYSDKTKITGELSRYAWQNENINPIQEFISEGFSEFRNNKNCRPLARKIGERIMELYKKHEANL